MLFHQQLSRPFLRLPYVMTNPDMPIQRPSWFAVNHASGVLCHSLRTKFTKTVGYSRFEAKFRSSTTCLGVWIARPVKRTQLLKKPHCRRFGSSTYGNSHRKAIVNEFFTKNIFWTTDSQRIISKHLSLILFHRIGAVHRKNLAQMAILEQWFWIIFFEDCC